MKNCIKVPAKVAEASKAEYGRKFVLLFNKNSKYELITCITKTIKNIKK